MNNKNFYLVSSHLDIDFFTAITEDEFQLGSNRIGVRSMW